MESQGNLAKKISEGDREKSQRGKDILRESRIVSENYPITHLDNLGIVKISFPNLDPPGDDSRILIFYRENKIQVFNKEYVELAERLLNVYESSFGEKFKVEHHY
ncbi:MAG: hypothetical protein AABX03_03695 [Nanoarchaeota archaeon]